MSKTSLLFVCLALTSCVPRSTPKFQTNASVSTPQGATKPESKEQTISWEQAIEILKTGQVQSIIQAHSLDVGLITTNWMVFHTREPYIDEIFRAVRNYAPNHQGISMATE